MYDFVYRRPGSMKELVDVLENASDPSVLAGGQTLVPTLKLRLASPSDLVDLGGIDELKGIRIEDDGIVIGAMATHREVAGSGLVGSRVPALAGLAAGIGDPQVRHRGTIGGSIANNDPAADYPAACVGLDATIRTNRRHIAADDFFSDAFATALQDNEVVTAVSFPIPSKASYMKFPNRASRFAIVGVMVVELRDAIRVAVTGAGSGVFRDTMIEQALTAEFSVDAITGSGADEAVLNSDVHASALYRKHLIGVMAKRAVASALA